MAALWLGPDEWLLLAPEAEGPGAGGAAGGGAGRVCRTRWSMSGIARTGCCWAGAAATMVLNAGCPLDFDPDAFPIGMCTRTVLAKAEIVLWRLGAQAFRIEAARSFLPYVRQFLEEAGREFVAA